MSRLLAAVLLALTLAVASGCGKKGPLEVPEGGIAVDPDPIDPIYRY